MTCDCATASKKTLNRGKNPNPKLPNIIHMYIYIYIYIFLYIYIFFFIHAYYMTVFFATSRRLPDMECFWWRSLCSELPSQNRSRPGESDCVLKQTIAMASAVSAVFWRTVRFLPSALNVKVMQCKQAGRGSSHAASCHVTSRLALRVF